MFKTYFIDVIKNHYFDFSGRATRKQFWMWVLCCFIITFTVSFVLNFISGFCTGLQLGSAPQIQKITGIINGAFSLIFWLITLLPYLSIGARRFRDAGVSLILYVILMIFNVLGAIVMFASTFMFFANRINSLTFVEIAIVGMGISAISGIIMLIICILPTKQTQLN